MKPAPFEIERPATLAEARTLLANPALEARALAGGQSLGPMLNLRLVRPQLLVDLTGIPELLRVEDTPDAVTLGACITHADIEDGRVPDATGGPLARVAAGIAYRAVRNRGTIGGSLSHADPAADWVSVLSTLGAEVVIHGAAGQRLLPIDKLIVGPFDVALAPGEIIEAVRIPRRSPRARWGYCKFCRKPGEFAHALAAMLVDPERGVCRVTLGALGGPPILVTDAAMLFDGGERDGLPGLLQPDRVSRLLEAKGVADPIDRQIHVAAMKRAVAEASRA